MTVTELLGAVGAAIGVLLGLATLGGLLVRYALLPWLQTHIVTPMREVNHQVTVNGHVSATPTLLDRVDTASEAAQELSAQVTELQTGQKSLGGMLDGHLDRSAGEWGRLWEAIHAVQRDLRDHIKHHPPREDTAHE